MAATLEQPGRMPALYLSHGAPPLIDDTVWPGELAAWAAELPRPSAILVVSAHWEADPITIGAATPVPLVYDFSGFPERYYRVRYDQPGALALAAKVRALLHSGQEVAQAPERGLDHGAYVPLTVMYPEADIPVLQLSMPDLDAEHLFAIGRQLAPLRDEGVLIVGSGFMTHGLAYIRGYRPGDPPPSWSTDFDAWTKDALDRGAVDELLDYQHRAPALKYAHPRVEHFAPLFVTLGAAADPTSAPEYTVEGYFMGLSKRSFQVA